jgi:hypothetical protein
MKKYEPGTGNRLLLDRDDGDNISYSLGIHWKEAKYKFGYTYIWKTVYDVSLDPLFHFFFEGNRKDYDNFLSERANITFLKPLIVLGIENFLPSPPF